LKEEQIMIMEIKTNKNEVIIYLQSENSAGAIKP
jgi:hypothetical protein